MGRLSNAVRARHVVRRRLGQDEAAEAGSPGHARGHLERILEQRRHAHAGGVQLGDDRRQPAQSQHAGRALLGHEQQQRRTVRVELVQARTDPPATDGSENSGAAVSVSGIMPAPEQRRVSGRRRPRPPG